MPSKSFNFDKILLDAMIKFSILYADQEFHHGLNKVSLQKTFQSSTSLLNAFFWVKL